MEVPAEDTAPLSRRPPLHVVRGGERERDRRKREKEDLTLSPPPPQHHHHRAKRELRVSERRMVWWLSARLGTAGADAMVREYGVRTILDAIFTQEIVVRDDMRAGRLAANPALRSPGGFLRYVLKGGRGR